MAETNLLNRYVTWSDARGVHGGLIVAVNENFMLLVQSDDGGLVQINYQRILEVRH